MAGVSEIAGRYVGADSIILITRLIEFVESREMTSEPMSKGDSELVDTAIKRFEKEIWVVRR